MLGTVSSDAANELRSPSVTVPAPLDA